MIKKLMFKTSLLAFLLCFSTFANGPLSALAQGLGQLTQGLSEINLESEALGIDQGIIAGAVISLSRQVEKNPFPTGKHDQFLVKDHMKLGYQLGAGYIVSGIASYVQEWTLVYPVATSTRGSLSRAFLVDLFLPLRINKLEEDAIHRGLPKDYTLIREASLQGHGRIKIGGSVPLTLGLKGKAGRVSLNKNLIKRHPNKGVSVMREVGAHYELASEIWMNFFFFDLPISDSSYHNGSLTRVYLKIPERDWKTKGMRDLALSLLNGQANEELENLLKEKAISRKIESRFNQTTTDLTFLALFNRDTLTREDTIEQSLYRENGQVDLEKWWVYQDRHSQDWTTVVESEELKSHVFLEGKWQDIGLIDPLLTLNIFINDYETDQIEYQKNYFPLLDQFKENTELLKKTNVSSHFRERPHSLTQLIFTFDQQKLEQLLLLNEEDWFKALKDVTGKDESFWRQTARTGFHGRDRRRMRQNRITLHDLELAKKAMAILRLWKKANRLSKNKDIGSQTAAYRTLGWAMRRSLLIGRGTWNTIILQAMMKMVAPTKKILSVSLPPTNHILESKNIILRTSSGIDYEKSLTYLRPRNNILLEDPSEIYHHFRLLSP